MVEVISITPTARSEHEKSFFFPGFQLAGLPAASEITLHLISEPPISRCLLYSYSIVNCNAGNLGVRPRDFLAR